jgi:hypothetical protein
LFGVVWHADLLILGSSEREFLPDNAAFVRSPQPWVFSANGRKPMTVRTTRTTISFLRPFKLRDLDDIQPAGDYLLDTNEELIEGLSRLAYRCGIFGLIRLGETGKKLEVD